MAGQRTAGQNKSDTMILVILLPEKEKVEKMKVEDPSKVL